MENKKRRNRKQILILILFIIIILIYLVILAVINYRTYKLNNDIDIKKSIIEKNRESLTSISKNIEALEDNVNFYENIDEEIIKIKKEYYEDLKKFEDLVLSGNTNYKIAYLTFDDGPYDLTNKYLEILRDNNILATFFTIGLDKERCYDNRNLVCSEMYQKIVNDGHTIANHTYSHLITRGLYSSSDEFIHQVKLQEELIRNKTGVITNIVRFPGGSSTASYYNVRDLSIQKLRENNYGWVDWTALDGDGGALYSTSEAMNNLRNTIDSNVEVILLHDYSNITIQILPELINYLKDNNYVILPLFYESNMVNK